ncbi:HdeD family acid-resistance protein [Pareuzebyella sediminis]|uniref:HdeD family acid-resistance protein n=1 Tax=Pareuzebyella sediminis TaxID=2607998 RepID=UPI0011EDFC4F|nr:DUF308 domain-containing protein [Pareuzebyella sediminis]
MNSQTITMNKPMGVNPKYWWAHFLLGFGLMALSIWSYFTPIETYISFALLFSYAMLATGIFEIFNAFNVRKHFQRWSWVFLAGFVDLVIGCYLITYESVTLSILPYILGIWLIFRSLTFIMFYWKINSTEKISKWALAIAFLNLIFALVILINPLIGELSLVYLVSFALFFMGLFRITLGFQLWNG